MKDKIKKPHIIFSTERPLHPASHPTSHKDAIGILSGKGRHKNIYPITGKYGKEENSILISHPTEAQTALAHKIATDGGQESIVSSDGYSHKLIYLNGKDKGKVKHAKGTTWHKEKPEDYYSTLPTGEHFTHNFGGDEEGLEKADGDTKRRLLAAVVGLSMAGSPAIPNAVKHHMNNRKEAKAKFDYQNKTRSNIAHNLNLQPSFGLKLTPSVANPAGPHLGGGMSIGSDDEDPEDRVTNKQIAQYENSFPAKPQMRAQAKNPIGKSEGLSKSAQVYEKYKSLIKAQQASLGKGSKNVKERIRELHGKRGDPTKKEDRQSQISSMSRYSQRQLGLPVVPSKGKITNELTGERAVGSKGKSPKPDWRSGNLESEQTSQAVGHELGHIFDLPEGMSLPEAQRWMDEGSARAGGMVDKYGNKRAGASKQIREEIVPMAYENAIRRRSGVPSFSRPQTMSSVYGRGAKDKLKWTDPERRSVDQDQPYAVRVSDKRGNPQDLIALTQNLPPQSKERLTQIDEGSLKFNPKKGWERSSDPNALINLRGRGQKEEAQQRAKQRFGNVTQIGSRPKKLAASEKQASGTTEKMHSTGKNTKLGQIARKKTLEGFKKQPKPNLGKADKIGKYGLSTNKGRAIQYNNEKGVNKPVSMGTGGVGVSSQGSTVRGGLATYGDKQQFRQPNGGPNYDRGLAREKAKSTLKELKAMPSPNLGKSTSLEHYSQQQGLKSIDPKFKGKGVDVRTKGRDTSHPHSFFYLAGTEPEHVVASGAQSKYTVDLPDDAPVYDLAKDPEGHVKSAIEQNNGALNMDMVHEKLKDAGYQGFANSLHPTLSIVVALYHETKPTKEEPVRKSYFDQSRKQKQKNLAVKEWDKKNPNRPTADEAHKKAFEDVFKPKIPKPEVKKQEGTDCDDKLAPLKKPYVSEKQRGFFNSPTGKAKLGEKAVKHWNEASKGLKLPKKV